MWLAPWYSSTACVYYYYGMSAPRNGYKYLSIFTDFKKLSCIAGKIKQYINAVISLPANLGHPGILDDTKS